MAAQQPYDQQHDKNKPESAAKAISTTPAIIAAAVIPQAAPEQEDQQDDYQDQFHHDVSVSTAFVVATQRGSNAEIILAQRPASLPAVAIAYRPIPMLRPGRLMPTPGP